MEKIITCFMPANADNDCLITINQMLATEVVKKVYLLGTEKPNEIPENCEWIECPAFYSSATISTIAEKSDTEYTLVYTKTSPLELGAFALERFAIIAADVNAGLVYSDYYEKKSGNLQQHPVIDYQIGSLRDDFNFGSVLFYNTAALKTAVADIKNNYSFAAFYALRLKISQKNKIIRVPEYLYSEVETDLRKSGEKQFDYVDPKNRQVQVEMEQACTQHLKDIDGYLPPKFEQMRFGDDHFEFEASVVIPVRNRARTIEDAIKSVLSQKTKFKYNLIIVNNHSTDGTTEIIDTYAKNNDKIIHIVPERYDLGIGGCWTQAVMDARCGRFAVQLDSDDLYIDENTLQKIVDAFYAQQCAMVVGTYKMVNVNLELIPPGIIDHKEWTPENGRNNALRINGLGAPRAFYTPFIRKVKIPNVSYGEDYAVGLAVSRNFQIGRIYDPLYLCRRWDGNSDAALDVIKQNNNNTYKDRIRSIELLARIAKKK